EDSGLIEIPDVSNARGLREVGCLPDSGPGLTEVEIEREAARIAAEHNLLDLIAIHRTGEVPSGQTVVFVAAAAAHRREAFEATERMMDYLKTAAPLWKKEHAAAGARWIEPTARDHVDAARWSRS
ncbi:MAG: molybdenum cofactor biosynthesis protein MoaE, partial [Caulobacteraceae bacterium]